MRPSPPHLVPSPVELLAWLRSDCPPNLLTAANRHLADVIGWVPDSLQWCFDAPRLIARAPLAEAGSDQWSVVGGLGELERLATDQRVCGGPDDLEHPAAPLVRAWQQRGRAGKRTPGPRNYNISATGKENPHGPKPTGPRQSRESDEPQ